MKLIVVATWRWPKHAILELVLEVLGCGDVGNVLNLSTTNFSNFFCLDVFIRAIESKESCFEIQSTSIVSIKR